MTTTDRPEHPVAVVTGASGGLGQAFLLALHDSGFRVVALVRDADRLPRSMTDLDSSRFLAVEADVANETEVAAAFARVVTQWGRVDLLVNNAGVFGPSGMLDEIEVADVRATLETNCLGAFICAREAMRVMRQQTPRGGRIINNGSVSAHVPRPLSAAYTMSKHAITGLTKSIALDGRAFGIACGQIDIGNAATPMLDGVREGALQPDGSIVHEPAFDPGDAARAVVLMATLPPDANVFSLTIGATTMPLVGRG